MRTLTTTPAATNPKLATNGRSHLLMRMVTGGSAAKSQRRISKLYTADAILDFERCRSLAKAAASQGRSEDARWWGTKARHAWKSVRKWLMA